MNEKLTNIESSLVKVVETVSKLDHTNSNELENRDIRNLEGKINDIGTSDLLAQH